MPPSPRVALRGALHRGRKLGKTLLAMLALGLLFDLAYSAALEDLWSFLHTELKVIFKTPLVMLKMTQGR